MSIPSVHEGTTFRIFLPRHIPGAEELAEQAAEVEAPAITQTLVAADQVRRAAGAAAPAGRQRRSHRPGHDPSGRG